MFRMSCSAGLMAALSLGAAQPALAAPVVTPAGSDISFTARQMGVPLEGHFRQWSAQMAFDPRKPEGGQVSFTIQTGSASFGARETDTEIPKAEWLNVGRFPTASFQSTSIKGLGGARFEVTGKLSLKGSVRDVVVPVTLTPAGATTMATGRFTIRRLDFRIGEGDWSDTSMVANDVVVSFKLAISGLGPL